MDVRSTISFSIIEKGRLWGLISCHNYKPVFIDAWKRKIAYLMTQALASEITSTQNSVDLKAFKILNHQRLVLVEALERHPNLSSGLAAEPLHHLIQGDSCGADRKSTRLNSSHVKISYAVFCLKK